MLGPTTEVFKLHSFRYFQVQYWLGNRLAPQYWGFKDTGLFILPVYMETVSAPPEVMNIIHCSCNGSCKLHVCYYHKYGLPCGAMCKNSKVASCLNPLVLQKKNWERTYNYFQHLWTYFCQDLMESDFGY